MATGRRGGYTPADRLASPSPVPPMSEVTRILSAIEQGDPSAAEQLLPLVYDELRQLAAQKLAQEKPGQTLQATALVHEAYLRLVDVEQAQRWNSRRHFFAAAAEAMRRILVEAARRKMRLKHGGGRVREQEVADLPCPERPERLLAVDEALDRLAAASPQAAELVKLRYFGNFSNAQAASFLDISPRKANQVWAYARAWLREELGDDE
jgi:RNA polymerase sigma factor (TIGR02999 family)